MQILHIYYAWKIPESCKIFNIFFVAMETFFLIHANFENFRSEFIWPQNLHFFHKNICFMQLLETYWYLRPFSKYIFFFWKIFTIMWKLAFLDNQTFTIKKGDFINAWKFSNFLFHRNLDFKDRENRHRSKLPEITFFFKFLGFFLGFGRN